MSDPKLPHGTKRCKCTVCGEYFASPSSFDEHQKRRQRGCVHPASVGLVPRNGYWGWPGERPDPRSGDAEGSAETLPTLVAGPATQGALR